MLATTATANARVTADVAEQLGPGSRRRRDGDALVLRGPLDRESLRLGGGQLPDCRARGWPGWPSYLSGALPGSGIIYTLTVAAADEVAAFLRERGHRGGRLLAARTDQAERQQAEDDLLANRVKALVATSRARHGLRQARPRVRRPPRRAAVADRLLPAGRPRRARRRARRGGAAARPRGPGHLGYFASLAFPPERRPARRWTRWPTRAGRCRPPRSRPRVDLSPRGWRLMLKVLDVDGAVTPGRAAAGSPPASRGRTTRERYERVGRRAAAPSSRRCSTTSATAAAGWSSCGAQLDDPDAAAVRPVRQLHRRALARADVSGAGAEAARDRLARPGVRGRAAQDVADRHEGARRRRVRARSRPASTAEPGRALGRLTDIGWGSRAARPARRTGAPTSRSPAQLTDAVVQGARRVGLGAAAGRRGDDAVARPGPC